MAVNRAMDPKARDADINNKLQLFGIYAAFTKGKLPSNKQADVALNSLLKSKAFGSPSEKLSDDGKRLVADLREVIEQAKLLLLEKNSGDVFQDFAWQAQKLSSGDFKLPNSPVDKSSAQQHGKEAVQGLRTLGTLLITNGQFRKLLSDVILLLRSVAGDAASKAAGQLAPSEQQMAQIDTPAEDNTWHETPDWKKARADLQAKIDANKPFSKKDVQNAAQAEDKAAAAGDLTDRAQSAAADSQAAEKGRNYLDRTKTYLSEKVPEERRDQTIWRLKKMVVEIQGHKDYQAAIESLLGLAEMYAGHSRNYAKDGSGAVKGATTDPVRNAAADLKLLVERISNSTSADDFIDAINQVYHDAEHDPDLKAWFKRVNELLRKSLRESGYIMEERANEEWHQVYDQGQALLRGRYRAHTDHVADEARLMMHQANEDERNRALRRAVERLASDLGKDDSGQLKFKPQLIEDLTSCIIPAFFENVRYLPIPRIEYRDPQVDMVIENLVIEGDNMAPNVLEFGTDNFWHWARKNGKNKNKNKAMLAVSGIQLDVKGVAYYVHKKKGLGKMTDRGVMDIFLGGDGLSFKIEVDTAQKEDSQNLFKVSKVKVDLKGLKIKLVKSKFKLLFMLIKPILLRAMRPALQLVVERQIKQFATRVDVHAFAIRQSVKRAEEEFRKNPSPDKAQSIYQRYMTAVKDEMAARKKKVTKKTEDKEMRMAMTMHDSLFPDVKLDSGLSSKATEYADLAAKGEKWESPVFSIGSASETADAPKPAEPTRKSQGPRTGESQVSPGQQGFGTQVDKAFSGSTAMNGAAVSPPQAVSPPNVASMSPPPVAT